MGKAREPRLSRAMKRRVLAELDYFATGPMIYDGCAVSFIKAHEARRQEARSLLDAIFAPGS